MLIKFKSGNGQRVVVRSHMIWQLIEVGDGWAVFTLAGGVHLVTSRVAAKIARQLEAEELGDGEEWKMAGRDD